MKLKERPKVYVGLSGGVDSSVAAKRLVVRGYDVTGVFIKVWQPDFLECDWERERLDAMRVAAHLNIPFETFDAEDVYKKEVADYMIREYTEGRTPNPDVMCNQHVKFGAFLEYAIDRGAEMVATGHYAQLRRVNGESHLYRGVDEGKDQSYFLWTLTQDQLSKVMLPVGDTIKQEIRSEARAVGIPVSEKNDSQGICFLGQVDMKEFLSHYVDEKPGDVLDEKGEVIGHHDGAFFFTYGQRQGFTVTKKGNAAKPMYIIDKNLENNTITVAENQRIVRDTIRLTHINRIVKHWPKTAVAQFRYRQTPFSIEIVSDSDAEVVIKVAESVEIPSPGQSCVVYQGDTCLGGGIIS